MRLLILGASGGIGAWLTRLARERGHEVTALVRAGATVDSLPSVTLQHGDVSDRSTLERVVPGHDAVLSALGLRRAGRSPWAKLLSPPDLMQRVMTNLASVLAQHSIPRLLVVSAAGVGESFVQLTWPVKKLVRSGNIGVAYRDLEAMEAVLTKTNLDYLAVRPVTLTNGPPRHDAKIVDRYGLFSTIRRSDVAEWMLNAVEQPAPFSKHSLFLGR